MIENSVNEVSENVKLISTKGSTKNSINKYSILINCAKYFSPGMFQNYVVLTSANKYINFLNKTQEIFLWKSKRMSEESIKNSPESDNNFAPNLINSYPSSDVKLFNK